MAAPHDETGVRQLAGPLPIEYSPDHRSEIQTQPMEIYIDVAGIDVSKAVTAVQRIPVRITVRTMLPQPPIGVDANI